MIRKKDEMKTEVRENMRGGPGKIAIRHMFGKEEIRARTRLCSILTLPPGAGIGLHRHDAEDELFVINRGTGMISDGREQTRVSEGDAVLTGGGESHALLNDGDGPLEITAVIMLH